MKISENGLSLIKRHEGLRLEAYRCPAGVVTIGYGHTRTARIGMVIREEEADRLLRSDVRMAEQVVDATALRTLTPLQQNQFDALVSFVFNVGSGNFATSTLRKKVVANPADKSIGDEFEKWVHAGGKKMTGLVNRRKDERELYDKK